MHRASFLIGCLLLLFALFDSDWAMKHHRDRGGHKHEQESLLDKQERERDQKDRKKDEEKKEAARNVTCYQCSGDLCRDPFKADQSIPTVQCDYNCWKGGFASSIRRGCGNKRCALTFQGGSAMSNTCCQTSLCNHAANKLPSMLLLLTTFITIVVASS